jgi:hypothetical protein
MTINPRETAIAKTGFPLFICAETGIEDVEIIDRRQYLTQKLPRPSPDEILREEFPKPKSVPPN